MLLTSGYAGQMSPTGNAEQIYARTTIEFGDATLCKPGSDEDDSLVGKLAPLIIQESDRANGAGAPRRDEFGKLALSTKGRLTLDKSQRAIYGGLNTTQLSGSEHVQVCFLWCYSVRPNRQGDRGLPLQGIRITLNRAGQPAIWETLADSSGTGLIFVSQSLEAAAKAEFGKPLPGRRHAIEAGTNEAPGAVVARVIEDGPVAMGPIVYLSADTRDVSTLICRCMPAQAKRLVATSRYEALNFEDRSTGALLARAKAQTGGRAAFWPGDVPGENRVARCLRLPRSF